MDEEDVALLERQLVRVRHLGVRQDGHHPLPVIHLVWGKSSSSNVWQLVYSPGLGKSIYKTSGS